MKKSQEFNNHPFILASIVMVLSWILLFIVFYTLSSSEYKNPTYTRIEPDTLYYHDIAKNPTEVPALPEVRSQIVEITIAAQEVISTLDDEKEYVYFTYGGTVPGPFLRIRVNDTVRLTFENDARNYNHHSIDLHAVTGPGGGASITQLGPGERRTIQFKALNEGLYVYHCATPLIAGHVANGMYGLILVEPEGGLHPVDKEFYVMQGEVYQNKRSRLSRLKNKIYYLDETDMKDEKPSYIIFNGRTNALIDTPLEVDQYETVRIFLGNGGVSTISSFHIIGEIFDTIYPQGSLTSPAHNVQVAAIFPGGSNMVEFQVEVPGKYILVDHALARLIKGAAGNLIVSGEDPIEDIFSIVE